MAIGTRILVPLAVLVCTTAYSHHGLGAYDSTRTVALTGVIRRAEVANPHVAIVLETRGRGESVQSWIIEMGRPSDLRRRGIDLGLLAPGQSVTIESWVASNGSRMANGRTLVTSDGHRLDVSDSVGWQKH